MHELVAYALRRALPGTGSDPKQNWQRTAFQPLPDLHQILGAIPWALVGALAWRAYTAERMTETVDVLIHARDADAARTALQDCALVYVDIAPTDGQHPPDRATMRATNAGGCRRSFGGLVERSSGSTSAACSLAPSWEQSWAIPPPPVTSPVAIW
jgi:hypothetical protein